MSDNIEDFDYVVIGAGIAGNAAVRGIRNTDTEGSVAIFGDEGVAPYTRPALSKALWRDPDTTVASIALGELDDHIDQRFDMHVDVIDAASRTIGLSNGDRVGYGSLILATGGVPRSIAISASDSVNPQESFDDRIIPFRNLADYEKLRALTDTGKHVVVVGGGFIGTELAAALRLAGDQPVTYVFSQPLVGGGQFPEIISRHLDDVYRSRGINLVPNTKVSKLIAVKHGVELKFVDGSSLFADAVVLGLGIDPDTALAADAGLAIDVEGSHGVIVDEYLRTSDASIFAAGDIAAYPDTVFGRRRVEHEDAANTQGELAGRNAAGKHRAYTHLPFFYSDLFDDGYEALGKLSSQYHFVIDGEDPAKACVVYYLDEDRVLQGVLMWNVWGDDDHDTKALATELLRDRTPKTESDLIGKI